MMTKPPYPSDQQDKFMLRLPDGMRERIKAASEANNRSMNAEIVAVLEEKYPALPASPLAEHIAMWLPNLDANAADLIASKIFHQVLELAEAEARELPAYTEDLERALAMVRLRSPESEALLKPSNTMQGFAYGPESEAPTSTSNTIKAVLRK